MNKFNLLLTAAAVVFSTPAMARNSDGGFVDVNVITVEEAKNMNDDAYVILQGYITDRNGDEKYVFQDKCESLKDHIRQFCKFIGARFATMLVEVGGVWLLVEKIGMNDMIGKFITQFIVLTLNYIFSKFLVFTSGRKS